MRSTFSPKDDPGHATVAHHGLTSPFEFGRGIKQEGRRIQELMERVDAFPNSEAGELLHVCLRSILALHGAGLARILQLVKNTGAPGRELADTLANDKLVRGMLLIHGLHPVPLETRLRQALEKVRPYAQSHGGNVELVRLEDEVAVLRLEGTCKTCPSSTVTLELAVRHAVEEACPDLLGFAVEGVLEQSPVTGHTPNDPPLECLELHEA